ncbi:MAG: hypothetical protein IPN50_13585 [Sphingomonadales bacterium]|jgi:hypothetical protein|uniref:hypothetical protein n=3 Tax=Sphingorhabdus sp. TaxID=1902408 RepID=UPI003BAEFC5E|nr:hypothetical protein [Sphingomonadales bacterium]MBL0020991.1 hypothetical protein [Sphingomonadales bacterium]
MSFTEFVTDSAETASPPGTFRHSLQTLPAFKAPTEAQTAERAAKAKAIATEIGQKFDGEYQPLAQQMLAGQTQLFQFYQIGMPPPLALFQSVVYQLVHLSNLCKSFQADADALAVAGAADFKSYLKLFVDDAATALAQAQASPTAFMTGPPLDPATFYASMGINTLGGGMGAASPSPIPPTKPGNAPPSAAQAPSDWGIFADLNKKRLEASTRMAAAWDKYIRDEN